MKKIKLTNTFHRTECYILSDIEEPGNAWYELRIEAWASPDNKAAKAKMRRVWNRLCGIEGCACGVVRP